MKLGKKEFDIVDLKILLREIKMKLFSDKKKYLFLIIIICLLLVIPYFLLDIKLIGDEDYDLCIYDKYFENGCISKFLFFEIDDISITSDLDNQHFGDYTINYETKFLFYKKSIKRNIHVYDNKKPSISLEGNDTLYYSLNDKYEELGYSAYDNYDLDITDKVLVSDNLKMDEEGEYEVIYEVVDSSNNKASIKRKVIVKENNYLSLPVDEFWLEDIFPDVILKPQEEEIDYFDEVVLLGDSNTWFLYKWSHLINAEQCWGKRNLNMAEINSSVFENFVDGNQRTLEESIETFNPKYLIISPGIGSPLFMNDTVRYVKELKDLIKNLRDNHPEISFAFSAILPLNDGQLSKEFQKKINIYNYYLAEVCHNNNVKLINFSDTIRGEDGYGIKSKFVYSDTNEEDRGFHLSVNTRIDYVEYLKHCDIKGE